MPTTEGRLMPSISDDVRPAALGDVWCRVDGSCIDDGSETYCGMELSWTTWRAVKVTPQGAWFQCIEWDYRKKRFALTRGAKGLSRTKAEALSRLIARKTRQLRILEGQQAEAEETLALARAAMKAKA